MVKIASNIDSLFVPVSEISRNGELMQNSAFDLILNGRKYVTIGTQILFEENKQYFLTKIDNHKHTYTVDDYQELPVGAPYQLIDGKLEFMPSPYDEHQRVSGNLFGLIFIFLRKYKIGHIRHAPLDVHFDKNNIFQPDLLFISKERENIIQKFIHGAPDLVVEILSSNKSDDLVKKMDTYGKFNVLEYWVIDYDKQTLALYLNENNKMGLSKIYRQDDLVKAMSIADFSFNLNEIFE